MCCRVARANAGFLAALQDEGVDARAAELARHKRVVEGETLAAAVRKGRCGGERVAVRVRVRDAVRGSLRLGRMRTLERWGEDRKSVSGSSATCTRSPAAVWKIAAHVRAVSLSGTRELTVKMPTRPSYSIRKPEPCTPRPSMRHTASLSRLRISKLERPSYRLNDRLG